MLDRTWLPNSNQLARPVAYKKPVSGPPNDDLTDCWWHKPAFLRPKLL